MFIPIITSLYRRFVPAPPSNARPSPVSIHHDLANERMESLLAEVGKFYGFSVEALKAPSRVADLVHARHVAFYIASKHLGLSLPGIGRMFRRDHTTILHGVRKIQSRLDKFDEGLAVEIATLKLRIDAQ